VIAKFAKISDAYNQSVHHILPSPTLIILYPDQCRLSAYDQIHHFLSFLLPTSSHLFEKKANPGLPGKQPVRNTSTASVLLNRSGL